MEFLQAIHVLQHGDCHYPWGGGGRTQTYIHQKSLNIQLVSVRSHKVVSSPKLFILMSLSNNPNLRLGQPCTLQYGFPLFKRRVRPAIFFSCFHHHGSSGASGRYNSEVHGCSMIPYIIWLHKYLWYIG